MIEKQFTENYTQKERTKQRNTKIFQTITLVALPLFWVGYFYALYSGNDGNVSNYSLLILAFSLLNSDVLFAGKKTQQKALDILAELDAVLFLVWAAITIIRLIFK